MSDRVPLLAAESVTLDAAGGGQVTLGPGDAGSRGPAYWQVTGIVVQTNRPGVAPIPRFQVYRDEAVPENSLGLYYDGSFGQGAGEEMLPRGSRLIGVWSGGQAGDRATMTVTGEKW